MAKDNSGLAKELEDLLSSGDAEIKEELDNINVEDGGDEDGERGGEDRAKPDSGSSEDLGEDISDEEGERGGDGSEDEGEEAGAGRADEDAGEAAGEEESKDEELARLRAKIEELSAREDVSQTKPAEEKKPVEGGKAVPKTIEDLLEGVESGDLYDDKEKFLVVLKGLAEIAQGNAVQQVLQSLPKITMQYVASHAKLMSMREAFYKENRDLANYKNLVGQSANKVASEHPDWDVEKIFDEAANLSRNVLGLTKKAEKGGGAGNESDDKETKPYLNRREGGRGKAGGNKLSKLEREINELVM